MSLAKDCKSFEKGLIWDGRGAHWNPNMGSQNTIPNFGGFSGRFFGGNMS